MSIAEKLTTIAENEQKVYEAGKGQGVNEWFAEYQHNGDFGAYNYRFCKWTDELYKPVYPIKSNDSTGMFCYSTITDTIVPITIKERDTSTCRDIFNYCSRLRRIPKLIIEHLPTQTSRPHYSEWFYKCKSLEEITIVGKIKSSISFAYSPLNLVSAKNIILNNLIDRLEAGDSEYSQKVEFSEYTWNLLDSEGETVSPHDTSWRDYISELGWAY